MVTGSLDLRPSGAGAVMAGRATEQLNELDYFPTPPWAARAGAELIRRLDPHACSVWEPACGEGHMAFGLESFFAQVNTSDIADYSPAGQFPEHQVGDFLGEGPLWAPDVDWIASNPPFVLGEAFIRRAWEKARRGVAMLLRLQFTEGGARHAMFTRDCPLALTATFSERVPMFAGRWDPGGASATAYRWFFFLKDEALEDCPLGSAIEAAWAEGCWLETLIPPGTRSRLERREDLLKFGPLSVAACRRMAGELRAAGDAKSLKKAGELAADAARIEALLAAAGDPLFSGMED
jgi:hypothetical protein